MNLFFDCEFTGLHKNTTLISIGIVSEDHQTFYAEFTDYDKTQCDNWIKENVISNLLSTKPEIWEKGVADTQIVGNKQEVVYALKKWLKRFDSVQFVSDVCHYDFVLLIDLFGSAWDLPDNVNPACYDINQEIAREFEISQKEVFEADREYIVFCLSGQGVRGEKHNALCDAVVIMRIYECIQRNIEIEDE